MRLIVRYALPSPQQALLGALGRAAGAPEAAASPAASGPLTGWLEMEATEEHGQRLLAAFRRGELAAFGVEEVRELLPPREHTSTKGLVLSRRAGEGVWVGEVLLYVDDVRGRQVRLRFLGPEGVRIDREERRARRPSPSGAGATAG